MKVEEDAKADGVLSEEEHGDLLPESERGCFCDGCGWAGSVWPDGMVYKCIMCLDCDLCEDCYKVCTLMLIRVHFQLTVLQKRLAWNQGEPDPESWCGQDHAYVKGPIEGWRGVKDGAIRIGEEEIGFKSWLETLRTERWPKAWENFWKGESFLHTIGSTAALEVAASGSTTIARQRRRSSGVSIDV